jgi:hypothetical protein
MRELPQRSEIWLPVLAGGAAHMYLRIKAGLQPVEPAWRLLMDFAGHMVVACFSGWAGLTALLASDYLHLGPSIDSQEGAVIALVTSGCAFGGDRVLALLKWGLAKKGIEVPVQIIEEKTP